jgi:hypothetical protein
MGGTDRGRPDEPRWPDRKGFDPPPSISPVPGVGITDPSFSVAMLHFAVKPFRIPDYAGVVEVLGQQP